MTSLTLEAVEVLNDSHQISLEWSNGKNQIISISILRGNCPCALCQGHGVEKKFIPNKANRIQQVEPIGRYALCFHFADGHKSGLYRFDTLQQFSKDISHV